MLRQFAPQESLDRVFGQIDITKAEIGWAASRERWRPRRSAALLVEFQRHRMDALGDIARRLRGLPQTFDAQTEDLVPVG